MPFIIGVHSVNIPDLSGELLDIILIDLDGGAVTLPDNMVSLLKRQIKIKGLIFNGIFLENSIHKRESFIQSST
jgi:hypothetical protein